MKKKPMAEFNGVIAERGRQRRMNALMTVLAVPVVLFISAVHSSVVRCM
jgi:hypothetical protein